MYFGSTHILFIWKRFFEKNPTVPEPLDPLLFLMTLHFRAGLALSKNIYTIQPATFQIGIEMLICKIFLQKFIHEVTSIIFFDYCDNYSDIQQNSTCKAGNAQKQQMHVELARLHLQQFLFHKSFAKCFT